MASAPSAPSAPSASAPPAPSACVSSLDDDDVVELTNVPKSKNILSPGDKVYFPSRRLSDFVVHYGEVDFYVHKLELDKHSVFFRTYWNTLSAGAAASAEEGCSHPGVLHCIHVPSQKYDFVSRTEPDGKEEASLTTPVKLKLHRSTPVSADDMLDYLASIYFVPAAQMFTKSPRSSFTVKSDGHAKELVATETDSLPRDLLGVLASALPHLANYFQCEKQMEVFADTLMTTSGTRRPAPFSYPIRSNEVLACVQLLWFAENYKVDPRDLSDLRDSLRRAARFSLEDKLVSTTVFKDVVDVPMDIWSKPSLHSLLAEVGCVAKAAAERLEVELQLSQSEKLKAEQELRDKKARVKARRDANRARRAAERVRVDSASTSTAASAGWRSKPRKRARSTSTEAPRQETSESE